MFNKFKNLDPMTKSIVKVAAIHAAIYMSVTIASSIYDKKTEAPAE